MQDDQRPRRVLSDPRLFAYSAFTGLLAPLLALQKSLRRRKRIWRGGRFEPELEVPALPPYAGQRPHLVFHGPGYGEFIMMERVARAIGQARSDVSVSYCLRDPNVVADLRQTRPELRTSVWPKEHLKSTLRWLQSENPDVLILTEQFRFPILVGASARYGSKVALINGRSRSRKGLKGMLMAPFYRWQFAAFSVMSMQTDKYRRAAEEFAPAGCRVLDSGDIKVDLTPAEMRPELERWLTSDRAFVAAGSTETSEEELLVLQAFKKARKVAPCRLLIAPRRPLNLEGLLRNLSSEGLEYSRRTENGPTAEVMVLDTMGELSAAYGRCAAVYVGGSYSPTGGGHNVLEPLLYGAPVAYGMTRGHFEAIQKLVEEDGIGTRIADSDALAEFWIRFLTDGDERRRIGEKGRALLIANRGAIARTVEAIQPLIPPASPSNTF